jgi:hypothetical protein
MQGDEADNVTGCWMQDDEKEANALDYTTWQACSAVLQRHCWRCEHWQSPVARPTRRFLQNPRPFPFRSWKVVQVHALGPRLVLSRCPELLFSSSFCAAEPPSLSFSSTPGPVCCRVAFVLDVASNLQSNSQASSGGFSVLLRSFLLCATGRLGQ